MRCVFVCQNLVLVPNATAGINAVMNNVAVDLGPGDVVYMLSIGYGATKKIVESVCQRTGASMLIHGIDHIPRYRSCCQHTCKFRKLQ